MKKHCSYWKNKKRELNYILGAPGRASKRKNMLSKATRILSFDSNAEFDVEAVYIKMKASKTRQTMQQMESKTVLYSFCFGLKVSS